MTEPELLQLIDQAAREGWTELDLRDVPITAVPPQIGQLTQLRRLAVGHKEWLLSKRNPLATLPPEIGQLTQLAVLDLSGNEITAVPPELGRLANLRVLYLSGNQLTHVPPAIAQLTQLHTLDLSRNQLTAVPDELGRLVNLRALDLSFTGLTAAPPALAQLVQLQRLNLSGNQITAVPPTLGRLVNLERLYLSGNQLSELPEEMHALVNLQRLYLSGNRLQTLPAGIGQWSQLHQLRLSDNQLTAVPEEIGRLTHLHTLDLSRNQLTAVPTALSQLAALRELYLSGNPIPTLPAEVSHLPALQRLDMSFTLLAAVPASLGELGHLQRLDLSHNHLTAVPASLGRLAALQRLDLSHNQLSDVPDELGQLATLQELDLSGNQLSTLSAALGRLHTLTSLILSQNDLAEIPAELGQLVQLQTLILSRNKLLTLPAELGQLTQLHTLGLNHNKLSAVPPELGQLRQLTTLHLENNQVAILPATLTQLQQLSQLDVRQNPLPLPPELLAEVENPRAILEAYFQASRPLREAKLLLLGEGSVGKSSLVERLIHNRPPSDNGKTVGVDIHTWLIGETAAPSTIKINVWDFGGQEIYHATHEFFLSHRSLYLLLIDARQDEEANRLEYWLRLITSFGGRSPILLVVNKVDQGQRPLDERGLHLRYPTLHGIYYTSCTADVGIPALRQAIWEAVHQLPHVQDVIPATWFAVKEKLAALRQDYLPYENYAALCQAEGITAEAAQKLLARFLHDLGAALNFQDDRRLAGTHVLNPEWVTDGIYRILNHNPLQGHGILLPAMLDAILDPSRYPAHKHYFLLEMMTKFELCVPLADGQDSYLIPGLLHPQRPNFTWPTADTPSFQLRYTLLPSSVLARLMVRLYRHTWAGIRWRDGMVLEREGARALVQASRAERQIDVWLDGSPNGRRALLASLRLELDEIHASFAQLTVSEWVPIPSHPTQAIAYQDLLFYEAQGELTPLFAPIRGRIDVRALLDGIETPSERLELTLHRQLHEQFNLAELRDLTFRMGLNHEQISLGNQPDFVRELLLYCKRHGRLPTLAQLVQELRPGYGKMT